MLPTFENALGRQPPGNDGDLCLTSQHFVSMLSHTKAYHNLVAQYQEI